MENDGELNIPEEGLIGGLYGLGRSALRMPWTGFFGGLARTALRGLGVAGTLGVGGYEVVQGYNNGGGHGALVAGANTGEALAGAMIGARLGALTGEPLGILIGGAIGGVFGKTGFTWAWNNAPGIADWTERAVIATTKAGYNTLSYITGNSSGSLWGSPSTSNQKSDSTPAPDLGDKAAPVDRIFASSVMGIDPSKFSADALNKAKTALAGATTEQLTTFASALEKHGSPEEINKMVTDIGVADDGKSRAHFSAQASVIALAAKEAGISPQAAETLDALKQDPAAKDESVGPRLWMAASVTRTIGNSSIAPEKLPAVVEQGANDAVTQYDAWKTTAPGSTGATPDTGAKAQDRATLAGTWANESDRVQKDLDAHPTGDWRQTSVGMKKDGKTPVAFTFQRKADGMISITEQEMSADGKTPGAIVTSSDFTQDEFKALILQRTLKFRGMDGEDGPAEKLHNWLNNHARVPMQDFSRQENESMNGGRSYPMAAPYGGAPRFIRQGYGAYPPPGYGYYAQPATPQDLGRAIGGAVVGLVTLPVRVAIGVGEVGVGIAEGVGDGVAATFQPPNTPARPGNYRTALASPAPDQPSAFSPSGPIRSKPGYVSTSSNPNTGVG